MTDQIDNSQPTRRQQLRWIGWFGIANAALFTLIAQRYLWVYEFPDDLLGTVYVMLTFVSHLAVLAVVPMFLLLLPLVALRARKTMMLVGVVFAAYGLSILILDTNVFAEHRFHLNALTASLFETSTWIFVGILFVIFLAFEAMLADLVWRKLALAKQPKRGRLLAAVILACWIGSQGIHVWADAIGYTQVTRFTRFMPVYLPLSAKGDMQRLGLVDPQTAREQRRLRGSVDVADGQLNYPTQPMRCSASDDQLLNIVVILIDALRPDVIDPQLTPTLAAFRDESQNFNQAYSGGNSSRMGLFAMFYGLPSTYWQAFYDMQRAPILMDKIREQSYEVGLFSAPGFGGPTLMDRTEFAGWPNLTDKRKDLSVRERNDVVTADLLTFLDQRDKDQPFFSFIFYDPPTAEMTQDPSEALPMDDRFTHADRARNLWRQYRLANRVLDEHVNTVLSSLQDQDLLGDTIVIIASDHGYEFDDNRIGHYQHASNFTPTQLRSTLMIKWPGKPAATYDKRTMHHDIPVTLLQDVFGCENPPSEYSVGENLFTRESWDWMMAGSYSDHAIVDPNGAIVFYPGGFIEIVGNDGRSVDDAKLDPELVQKALEAQRRFLK